MSSRHQRDDATDISPNVEGLKSGPINSQLYSPELNSHQIELLFLKQRCHFL